MQKQLHRKCQYKFTMNVIPSSLLIKLPSSGNKNQSIFNLLKSLYNQLMDVFKAYVMLYIKNLLMILTLVNFFKCYWSWVIRNNWWLTTSQFYLRKKSLKMLNPVFGITVRHCFIFFHFSNSANGIRSSKTQFKEIL